RRRSVSCAWESVLDAAADRLYCAAGNGALDAVDHYGFITLQARADDAQAVDKLSELYRTGFHHVVAVHDEYQALRTARADGRVGKQDAVVGTRGLQLQVAEHAGEQEAVGIGDQRPALNGSGTAADGVVEEFEFAFPASFLLILQADAHRCAFQAFRVRATVAQVHRLRGLEHEMDGVDADNGGQDGIIGLHRIADV